MGAAAGGPDLGLSIPLLQWKAGVTALLHNVYVGTKPDLGPADLVAPSLPMTVYYYDCRCSPAPPTTGAWTRSSRI